MHRSASPPQAANPQIGSMVETLPLGDDAGIYGHQVCLGANIGCILLIDGGDVAPAKKELRLICDVIVFRPYRLQIPVPHEAYLNTKSAESISFPHLLFLMMPPFPTTAHFLNCDLE